MEPSIFVALDFETADPHPDSACALGLVRVERGAIVSRLSLLIRPPRSEFHFTHIHGIRWEDVAEEEDFAAAWPKVARFLEGAEALVAHNAGFDRTVLQACCEAAGVAMPALPFYCTVELARRRWSLFPTRLPDVCRYLGIPLRHHDAASDAEACARIVLAAGGLVRGEEAVEGSRRALRGSRKDAFGKEGSLGGEWGAKGGSKTGS